MDGLDGKPVWKKLHSLDRIFINTLKAKKGMKKRIILDTNFLLIPATLGVDIFSEIQRITDFEYELCVIDGTFLELEEISSQNGKNGVAAKVTLALLKSKHLNIIPNAKRHVDDAIVAVCDENVVVATQDAALRARAKAIGARVIVLRQKAHLIFA